MKTMTLDEVKKMPPLTKERVEQIKAFKDTDLSDCPEMTDEQLKQFKPWYEVEKLRKNRQTNNIIHLDYDVLEALKAKGKESEKEINEILRHAIAQS